MEAATHSTPPAAPSTNGGTPGRGPRSYDAIVVGGGHNGLTTTAYLARAGLRVVCLERRDDPRRRLRDRGALARRPGLALLVRRLDAAAEGRLRPASSNEFGYRAIPLDPAYASLTEEGPIFFFNEVEQHRQVDRALLEQGRRGLPEVRGAARPRGAVRAADDAARAARARLQVTQATSPRSCARRAALAGLLASATSTSWSAIFTMSVGDLLDDYFEHDGLKGSIASSGVVGVWAGPRTPGHRVQPPSPRARRVRRDRGRLGSGDRRDGRDQRGDRALRARRGRRDPHRRRGRLDRRPQRRRGAASRSPTAPSCGPRSSPPAPTRRRPSSTSPGPRTSRPRSREDMRRYRTRGGLGEGQHGALRAARLRGRHRLRAAADADRGRQHLPLDRLPRARLAGRHARQAGRAPVRRGRAALRGRHHADRRRPLGDDDVHPVRALARGGLEARRPRALRRRLHRAARPVRPQPPGRGRSSARCSPRRTSSGSSAFRDGSIFQGEQGLDQMAFMRPHPELAQYATPVDGLYLCGAGTHPGGGVTGCSGHNAAHRILKDRRRARRPWNRARSAA